MLPVVRMSKFGTPSQPFGRGVSDLARKFLCVHQGPVVCWELIVGVTIAAFEWFLPVAQPGMKQNSTLRGEER